MKKPYQSHNSITVFLVLITYVIWGIMTYFMIADGYFRVTLLFGLVPLGFLAWALVKGAKTISGVRLTNLEKVEGAAARTVRYPPERFSSVSWLA